MKKRNKKVYDDDDGRVISPMNVDGMPWHNGNPVPPSESKADETEKDASNRDDLVLTSEEKRAMAGGVFAAALLVAGVFVLVGFLFVLFCTLVWLR